MDKIRERLAEAREALNRAPQMVDDEATAAALEAGQRLCDAVEQECPDAAIVHAIVGLPMRLKAHRAARGLSLRDVEAATGVNNVTVLNIENGKDYRVSSLVALAEWLDQGSRR